MALVVDRVFKLQKPTNQPYESYACHTGDKTYTCELCYKEFSDSGSLTAHIVLHTVDKPYSVDCVIKVSRLQVNFGRLSNVTNIKSKLASPLN